MLTIGGEHHEIKFECAEKNKPEIGQFDGRIYSITFPLACITSPFSYLTFG